MRRKKAVKFKPDYSLGYFYLGMIETARKHVPEAIQFYETSAKFEPNPKYAADTRQKIADLKAGFMPPGDNCWSYIGYRLRLPVLLLQSPRLAANPGVGACGERSGTVGFFAQRQNSQSLQQLRLCSFSPWKV